MSIEPERSAFAGIYDATADAMLAEFKRLRSGLNHAGARGDAAEEIVRNFLAEALPASLGVAVGQVVDSEGSFSGQSDVIIYNAARTPMLFTSAQGGQQTVPVEGVVAVVEVKSVLQKKDLPQLVSHASKLKSLQAKAFFPGALQPRYELYGRHWVDVPPLYTVFAFSSDGLYIEELNELLAEVPPHLRVDNVCALDRGLVLNVCLTGDVSNPENLFTMSATSTEVSRLGKVETESPLLPWFAMNSSLWSQFDCRPINLSAYVENELRVDATVPGAHTEEFRDVLVKQMADEVGVSQSIVAKIAGYDKSPVTAEELLQLVEPFRRGLYSPATPEGEAIFERLSAVPTKDAPAVLLEILTSAAPLKSDIVAADEADGGTATAD